jgi:adenylate kinase
MRLALTGTPGTGKTTVADRLAGRDVDVVHLNDVVREEGLWTDRDDDRDSLVVDLDAVAAFLDGRKTDAAHLVVESHLAHLFDADRAVVLRCRPDRLRERLRERGESAASVEENAESEALDGVLSEAVERFGAERVHEMDTTDRGADAVADDVLAVLAGERDPAVGTVDFTEYL